jgi:hypothetical protein
MSRASLTGALRSAGVFVLGAFGLHQLTYLLAGGADAGHLLSSEGHGYLLALAPALIAGAVGAVLAALVISAFAPRRGQRTRLGRSTEARGALLALAFLAVFATQELVEGALIASHPHGLTALAQTWMALPLALPIGAIAAALLGGLDRAERLIAAAVSRRARELPRAPRSAPQPVGRGVEGRALSCLTLVFGVARRGPPLPGAVH